MMKTSKQTKLIRIYHPYWDWECYKAGFYSTTCSIDDDIALDMYSIFLKDLNRFGKATERVFKEWPNSCEHFLTNTSMNRIAWLGQAGMCIDSGIPSKFKGGFKLMSQLEQDAADDLALKYLKEWECAQLE